MLKQTFNSRQIDGYRAQLVSAVRQCQDGAYVQLDLRSAEKIVLILDQAIHIERGHEPPR